MTWFVEHHLKKQRLERYDLMKVHHRNQVFKQNIMIYCVECLPEVNEYINCKIIYVQTGRLHMNIYQDHTLA